MAMMIWALAMCASLGMGEQIGGQDGAGASAGGRPGEVREVPARVLRIREVRERTVQDAPRDMLERTSDQTPRRPRLVIDAMLDVGAKSRLTWVRVQSAQAKDSEGKDLIEGMLADAGGKVRGDTTRLQESAMALDHAPVIRWFVDAPGRGATSVSGTLVAEVGIADGVEKIELKPEKEWKAIEHASFKDVKAEYRVASEGGDGAEWLELRPAEIASRVYRVDPRATPRGQRERATPRQRDAVGYRLDRRAFANEPLSVTVFTNIWRGTVTFQVHNEPLP